MNVHFKIKVRSWEAVGMNEREIVEMAGALYTPV
jgi:hypothetical protein